MDRTLIKGGTVIDGTGAPRYQADVLVKDGVIAAIGEGLSGAGRVIDASGLVVAPGIVDPHTHLDGQLLFERKGSSSNWHGVTTVMMGLCGYSLAPCRPEDREYLIKMFGRVEEMPQELLRTALPWSWVTFREYLDTLDKGLGLNAVNMVGHSTLRYHVMGPASLERAATKDEVSRMKAVLRESLQAGAFGFTSARAPAHYDSDGRPVPSRQAAPEELIELAGVLREFPSTSMGIIPSGLFKGMTPEDKDLVFKMASAAQRPVQLNGFGGGDGWEFMAASLARGVDIWAVTSAQPFYKYVSLQDGTTHFNSMDTWLKIMDQPPAERRRMFADPALRPALRREVDQEPAMDPLTRRRPRINWDVIFISKTFQPQNAGLKGLSVTEIARRQGKHVADALLDLALSEDLKTVFETRLAPEAEWFDDAKAAIYRYPYSVPMASDAGAHLGAECKTGEGTYFLRRWVLDRKAMSLEEGVRKITSVPARYLGLRDRGQVRVGAAADIMAFDPGTLDSLDKEPARDFPGGMTRWIQRARGVQHVLVNGHPTVLDGKETGDLPGKVLRSGSYK